MITKKSLLVLGAGASAPYGFPTAHELRKRILSDFALKLRVLMELDFPGELEARYIASETDELANKFGFSGIDSIDKFILFNPHLERIGKYSIAVTINDYETRSTFREKMEKEKEEEDWYSYLYNELIEEIEHANDLPDSPSFQNLRIITFNFDRSLEYFLYQSLLNSFENLDNKSMLELIKQIGVHHVFGQIGSLPYYESPLVVNYRDKIKFGQLSEICEQINIVAPENQNQSKYRELVEWADKIFFLGFGFDMENMEILDMFGALDPKKSIYGTAVNLDEKEISKIKTHIIDKNESVYKLQGKKIVNSNIFLENVDCRMLLRKYLE